MNGRQGFGPYVQTIHLAPGLPRYRRPLPSRRRIRTARKYPWAATEGWAADREEGQVTTEFDSQGDSPSSGEGRGKVFGAQVATPGPGRPTPLQEMSRDLVIEGLWTRPGLPMRERRLITMTILARYNKEDFLALHVAGALENGEFTLEELDEVALHIAFYGGWPVGNMFHRTVEATVQKMNPLPPQPGAEP